MHRLSTIASSKAILSLYFEAISLAIFRNRPSVYFIMFALCTAVTFLRLFFIAYLKEKSIILREANSEIGLIEIPESSLTFLGLNLFIKDINFFALLLFFSNSTPAYKSSLFSRIMIKSTFLYGELTTPSIDFAGLTQANKSRF